MAKKRKVTRRAKSKGRGRKGKGFKFSTEQMWMMGAAALLVALGIWGLQRSPKMSSAKVSGLFQKAAKLPLGARMTQYSNELASGRITPRTLQSFKGAPNISDSAPLIGDKLNCTTFVETVAALSKAKNERDFYQELIGIRYRNGNPTFESRNHFPEADWINANVKNGRLEDITATLADASGVSVGYQEKTIEKGKWLEKEVAKGRVQRKMASAAQKEWTQVSVKLPYIAVKDLSKVKFPEGAVVNIVRESVDRNPVLITHQGLIIKQNGKTFFRHASAKGVINTVDLTKYIGENERPSVLGKIVGVNVNQLK